MRWPFFAKKRVDVDTLLDRLKIDQRINYVCFLAAQEAGRSYIRDNYGDDAGALREAQRVWQEHWDILHFRKPIV